MPVLVVAEAKAVWMNFLAQTLLRSGICNLEFGISNLKSEITNPIFLLFLLFPLRRTAQLGGSFLGTAFRSRLLLRRLAHFRRHFSFRRALHSRRRGRAATPRTLAGCRLDVAGLTVRLRLRILAVARNQDRHV